MQPPPRRRLRLAVKPKTPRPLGPAIGPVSSSGVKKPSKRTSFKTNNRSTIQLKHRRTKDNEHHSAVEALTSLMASTRISTPPLNALPTIPHGLSATPKECPKMPNESSTMPAELPPPPVTFPVGQATPKDIVPKQRITLNCRYRLPNSYLTVYHRRGHKMLCMPWEMPWLEGEEKAV